jgi:hypothetical protein
VKTAALLAVVAVSLPVGVSAAAPVAVDPTRAAVGETIVVSGPSGGVVSLEPLDRAGEPVPLGTIGASGGFFVKVPDVPHGTYRVVVAGSSEAPVLEVVALDRETSIALLAFGLLFILAVVVAGVVVHRRWRDAIS